MPSSRYAYVDDAVGGRSTTGTNITDDHPRRRRSLRIRRRTPERGWRRRGGYDDDDDEFASDVDPDETVLERSSVLHRPENDDIDDDRRERRRRASPSVIAPDGENEPPNRRMPHRPIPSSRRPPSKFDDADVDGGCRPAGDDHGRSRGDDADVVPRGGAGGGGGGGGGGTTDSGFLTNDPLTSSTAKSTPFSAIRARNARVNSRRAPGGAGGEEEEGAVAIVDVVVVKDGGGQSRLFDDDDDDGDVDLAREEEAARLRDRGGTTSTSAEEKHPSRTIRPEEERQYRSFASTAAAARGANDDISRASEQRRSESDATDRIGNNGASSYVDRRSPMESFMATQPWEKELDGLMTCNHRHESDRDARSSPETVNDPPRGIHRGRWLGDESYHRPGQQSSNANLDSQSMPMSRQHALGVVPKSRHDRTEDESKQSTNDPEPRIQWGRKEEDRSNGMGQSRPNKSHMNNYRIMNEPNHPDARSAMNPYLRKPPPPPTKTAGNKPKISSMNIESPQRQEKMCDEGNGTSRVEDKAIDNSDGKRETWREEAFRSSLLDTLGSFPTNIFDVQDEHERTIFVHENIDDESPHSTTQKAASSQLNRKRLFDAASRSLARLAIASRHRTNKTGRISGSRASDGSIDDVESPDFTPPSPRSLPAYMSVMNMHDDSNPGTFWDSGNGNTTMSSSTEVFSGHSVHGRNARTLRLSKVPPSFNVQSSNSNPFSSWSSEKLAFSSLVLAAQVCDEASFDANLEGEHPSGSGAESRRVTGYAQKLSTRGGNESKPEVLSSLVESCLGFLATAFACLESDFVYSVLRSTPRSRRTVFDTLSQYAPISSQDNISGEICAASTISLLALSRGLDATITVALSTSLDVSSACVAYASPHHHCDTHTGIDRDGVGWISALGRDLGLKLEDYLSSRPKHARLSQIAMYVYDFILAYNPMTVGNGMHWFHGTLSRDDEDVRRGDSRRSHYINTQGNSQSIDATACRQPSVMKDRTYAANVEYLTSLIRVGIVSGWLTSVLASAHEDGDANDSNSVRTVDKLCEKLFYVIDTVSRRRRSTNQNIDSPDPGDSEAVCAASLTLLVLILPEQVNQSEPSSLSTSFRQIGNSVGSIDDLLHSPLIRRMAEMALSWQDPRSPGSIKKSENQATSNAMYFLGSICMVGGSTLICSHFGQLLETFLRTIANSISERGSMRTAGQYFDDSNIDSCLFFALQLHTRSPIIVRTFLRNFMEGDDSNSFLGGLLHLATNESFAISSCASLLLRALVDGNPADRTTDRLSEIMLNSFHAGSDFEGALRLLLEMTFTSLMCEIPNYSILCNPRICLLGDLLGVLIHTTCASETFASSMSEEVLDLLGNLIECEPKHNQSIDSLSGSAKMSVVNLFVTFAMNSRKVIPNDESEALISYQQRRVKEKLICAPGHLIIMEAAMAQGTSADMTHRALKLQSALLPLGGERFLARMFTNSRNSVATEVRTLTEKHATYQSKMREQTKKCQAIELKCDSLTASLRDQSLACERQLEWIRCEHRMASRNASEIFAYERKLAEGLLAEERVARLRSERENERLTGDCSSYTTRIKELEDLLGHERSSREEFESALKGCKIELSSTSKELERTTSVCDDLKQKLAASEDKVSHLTAITDESGATLEDVCSKLVKLSTIYQVKEQEIEKHKAELLSAVNTANRHAKKAIEKYDSAKQKNMLMSKKLEDVTSELNDIKAHRADVQRMRKNAPVAYLNQLHKDATTLQEEGQRRSPRRQGRN